MKIRSFLFVALLLVIALSACQSAVPSVETQEPAASSPTQAPQGAPSEGETYPGPAAAMPTKTAPPPVAEGESLYPGPQSGEEISWEAAVALINNGEVAQVVQTHNLQVTLDLKDGRSLIAREPNIDDVFKVIDGCGQPCTDISVATE
ncbi:MAG: hypothetical protein P8074_01235 [Anaerolineales bacterium]|jgi:glucose/arabinose dehydrogenase